MLTLLREGSLVLSKALYKTIQTLLNANVMRKEEAYSILEVTDKDDIHKKYEYLYNINSKKNKGSKYLQSRIKNAYEFIVNNFSSS